MAERGPVLLSTTGSHFRLAPANPRAVLRVKSWQVSPTGDAPRGLAGCELPASVGKATPGSPRALCTGPGEWLVVYDQANVVRLRNALAPELAAQSLVLVDLTDGLVVLEVSGTAAREVLAKSCGLDFDARAFAVGHCARTRLAQIPVLIDCIQEAGVFELYVARTYAAYLTNWLLDAADLPARRRARRPERLRGST